MNNSNIAELTEAVPHRLDLMTCLTSHVSIPTDSIVLDT